MESDLQELLSDYEGALLDTMRAEIAEAAEWWREQGLSIVEMRTWRNFGAPYRCAYLAAKFKTVGISPEVAFHVSKRPDSQGHKTLFHKVLLGGWTVEDARAAVDDWHRRLEEQAAG